MKLLYTLLVVISSFSIFCQNIRLEKDKCGPYDPLLKSDLEITENGWGYSYDSLLYDIQVWDSSEFVSITSIGKSVQNRELYELTITDTSETLSEKHRIYIHVRTHPNEVQSFWVTNEIINILLSEDALGEQLRQTCIFHIVPMYNPDGVELGYNRENANQVNIESIWDKNELEPEVIALQGRFKQLMQEPNPIEIALNMHSAAKECARYFVYHHENGTSSEYAMKEEYFISTIRRYFPEIQPYYFFTSWASSTPTQYPESWWWMNHGEEVMALTYEDMNCSLAGDYDKTAFAILSGIADVTEFGYKPIFSSQESLQINFHTYPNPFIENIAITWNNSLTPDFARVIDVNGNRIADIENKRPILWNGKDQFNNPVPSGMYIIQFSIDGELFSKFIIKQ